jgi:hypothetical protein
MLKKISDFYQTAVVNDLQCVAYAYRPLAIEKGPEPLDFNPSTNGFITLPMRVLPETDGNKLDPQSSDSGNPSSHDHDEIEEEPIPVSMQRSGQARKMDMSSLPDPVNIVIHIGGDSDNEEEERQYGASVEDQGASIARIDTGPLQRWRKLREMDLLQTEDDNEEEEEHLELAPPVDSQEFIEEAIQGQIFLGMTTLAHQPKTVRCSLFINSRGLLRLIKYEY